MNRLGSSKLGAKDHLDAFLVNGGNSYIFMS